MERIVFHLVRCITLLMYCSKFNDEDILSASHQHRLDVHKALCDNIDTRTALDTIRDLLSEANKYMNSHPQVRITKMF